MAAPLQGTRPSRWPKQPAWLRVVREPSKMLEPQKLRAPSDTAAIVRAHGAETEEVEVFYVLLLDAQNKVRGLQEVTRGILNSTLVHPREVFPPRHRPRRRRRRRGPQPPERRPGA